MDSYICDCLKAVHKLENQNNVRRKAVFDNEPTQHQADLKTLRTDYLIRVCKMKLNRYLRSERSEHLADLEASLKDAYEEHSRGIL